MTHRDGRPINGVIRPEMEVHCSICEEAVLGLGTTVRNAEGELRNHYGWRKVRGLWQCRSCVGEDPE